LNERRTTWLLVLVLAVQLLLLAAQVRSEGGATLLEQTALRLVGPVGRLVAGFFGSAEDVGRSLRSRGELQAENRQLQGRIETLELELFRLRNVEEERERLAEALEYTPQVPGRLRPTQVVYLDHSSWLRTLILYVGRRTVRQDEPVITPAGLVGRVILTAGSYAKVQLITDRAAAASAVIERTRRQALVRGGNDGLELDFVPLQASVEPGDRVLTAGTDGIYPRGIPIGTVVKVGQGDELFRDVLVTPAVDFAMLDRVYLLERETVPDELKENEAGARP